MGGWAVVVGGWKGVVGGKFGGIWLVSIITHATRYIEDWLRARPSL